jgi:multidrug efflux pump subunit AcrB/outer membrane protein TolC
MIFADFVFQNKRVIGTLTIIFVVLGLLSLRFVPKAEDPRLPNWWATVTVILPGGAPNHIDDTIARPLVEQLKSIEELKKIETSVKSEAMVMQLEMRDSVSNTEDVWNKVREKIDRIKIDFPRGTLEPILDTAVIDLETILISVHGHKDPLYLKKAARDLKQRLLTVSGTSKVIIHGDPKEEIQIKLKDSPVKEKSISRPMVYQKIQDRNSGIPAGAISVSGRQLQLQVNNIVKSPDEVQEIALPIGSGEPSSVGEISTSSWSAKADESLAYFNGDRALFLGVVAQHPIEIVDFGQRVREEIKKTRLEGISVSEVSFNPERTQERLSELGMNLLVGIVTVGGILSLWMGWRIAFLVTLFLPVISIIAFQIYSLGGGILHQISLAAFVISLGQFVDNIIVIVESIQRKMDEGISSQEAAYQVIEQVKRPMLFATGTNMAAFIPMLASSGSTAEFTSAIPVIALLTLVCAYLLSIFAVPLMAESVLRPVNAKTKGTSVFTSFTALLAGFITLYPKRLILLSAILLSVSGAGFVFVKQQFFPSADRNQFLVNIELQQSSSLQETIRASEKVQNFLLQLPQVEKIGTFIGEPVPMFYYNLNSSDFGKHLGQLIVITKDKSLNAIVADKLKHYASQEILDARVQILKLEQGPPIQAPIEYRVFSEDEALLANAVEELEGIISDHSLVEISKHNLGDGLLTAKLEFNSNLGERFGIDNPSFALNLLTSSQGSEVGKVFKEGEALSLRLMSSELLDYDSVINKFVAGSNYRDLVIKDLALSSLQFSPTHIDRLQGQRMARVLAWPKMNYASNQVTNDIDKRVMSSPSLSQVRVEKGGEEEGASDANMAILRTVPLGLVVLLMFLLLEFNSFRKVTIILFSVPLVVAGVTPGLLIGDAAFGFMSLLGVLALVGIVVNNSILLIETIDEELKDGRSLKGAVEQAVTLRCRPILLTALTTIAGLLPMAFEDSTLWPPLALAMISGLFSSTILTLFVVPALYLVVFQLKGTSRKLVNPIFVLTIFLGLTYASNSIAKTYTVNEALEKSNEASILLAAKKQSASIEALAEAQWRAAHMPKLGLEWEYKGRNESLTQTNGFGTFEYGKKITTSGGMGVVIPLFDAPEMGGNKRSMESSLSATKHSEVWAKQNLRANLLEDLLSFEELRRTLRSVKVLKMRLNSVKAEALRFRQAGTVGQSDILKIEIAIADQVVREENLETSILTLKEKIKVVVPDFEDLSELQEGDLEVRVLPSSAALIEQRADIRALSSALESQEHKVSASRQSSFPRLELRGRYVFADQGLLDQKDWTEASLAMTWSLYEGGTRSSLTHAELAKKEQLHANLDAAKAFSRVEQTQGLGMYHATVAALKVADENLKKAMTAATEDRRNAQRGKSLVRDWLLSEIALEERKLDLDLLKIKKAKALIEIYRSYGLEL